MYDCSCPVGNSLNDTEHFSYRTIQDVLELITLNCFFAKIDLSSAYRSVKIHPSNNKATGLKWRFYGDSFEQYFGARRSPLIFNTLSRAVRDIMACKGYDCLVVRLDDFLIIVDTWTTNV